jgi:hypothetical protein
MDEHRRLALLKTSQIAMVLVLGFMLGQYSVEFSGSALAWIALVLDLIALPTMLFLLIREYWKVDA